MKVSSFQLSRNADAIRKALPTSYFVGVLACYAINAALVVYFLTPVLAKWFAYWAALGLAICGALAAQYFRALIVASSQLLPNGQVAVWEKVLVHVVAAGMTIWAIAEANHMIASLPDVTPNEYWAIMLFSVGIILGGYILEISYVAKLNRLTSMEVTTRRTPTPRVKDPEPLDVQLSVSGNANGRPVPQ